MMQVGEEVSRNSHKVEIPGAIPGPAPNIDRIAIRDKLREPLAEVYSRIKRSRLRRSTFFICSEGCLPSENRPKLINRKFSLGRLFCFVTTVYSFGVIAKWEGTTFARLRFSVRIRMAPPNFRVPWTHG